MAFDFAKKILRLNKFPTLVTFVSAIIAFSLSLVVLLSNGSRGQLSNYEMMMLNTSTLLQNAVKVENVASTTAAKMLMPRATPPPDLAAAYNAKAFERGLLSDASTFFAGLNPTATSGLVASATSALGAAESILNGALGGLGTLAGQEVEKVVNLLIQDVVNALGIQQYYKLYMMEYCSGQFIPNYADPKAVMNVTACTKYSAISIPKTNSTLTLGQTRLDFSAINFPNKLSSAGGSLTTILTVIFALQVIGVGTTGLLILICPLSLVFSVFNGTLVRFAIASLALTAAIALSIDAGVLTAVPVVAGQLINQLAGDLGAQAHAGNKFIAMTIVSGVLMGISALLWAAQWFDNTFARRSTINGDKVISAKGGSRRELRIGAPVIVKTPREAYDPQETGTVRSV